MKLLVNISPLLKPHLTGIGHYTREIVARLLDHSDVEDIVGFSGFHHFDRTSLRTLLENTLNNKNSVSGGAGKVGQSLYTLVRESIKRVPFSRNIATNLLQRNVQHFFADKPEYIYWESGYTMYKVDNPVIATIYDLSHVRYRQFHPAGRVRWFAAKVEYTVKNADRLITVSEFSKTEIQRVYGVPAAQISVIYPGVSEEYLQTYSPEEIARVAKHYNIPQNYLLAVGTLEPRKNIAGLLHAYLKLPTMLRKNFPLVLVGCKGWQHSNIDKLIASQVARGEIYSLGYVAQDHLPLIYQGASALAYVSFYEGFGMPVAEALASGIPVITSDRASMPEVAGGRAELINPEDIDSIANGLLVTLEKCTSRDRSMHTESKSKRAGDVEMHAKKTIANRFDWQVSADRMIQTAQAVRGQ
ncbi:MAG: hypothetical protein DRR06_09400 [Gammaproteobacteria bacterium]|nr:MAG: hypothetical protein DRR06_09400 [Gammaproteobacteria bacterium]